MYGISRRIEKSSKVNGMTIDAEHNALPELRDSDLTPGPNADGLVGMGREMDPNLVAWDKDDRENPMNWARGRKWSITLMMGLMTFVCTFASSVFSTAIVATSKEYEVSTEVMTLGVSLYVFVSFFRSALFLFSTDSNIQTGFCIWSDNLGTTK